MSRLECGVCRDACHHGLQAQGGNQFCVFCLRMHGDHLDMELKACEREKLVVISENETLRGEKSALRGTLLLLVNHHVPGDALTKPVLDSALASLSETDWKRW
jgi:hypothetical protein